jgi:hypothetical protein
LRSQAPGDYKSFQKSFEAAWQYRDNMSPETLLRRLEEIFASKPQHEDLANRITSLETILKEPPRPSHRSLPDG